MTRTRSPPNRPTGVSSHPAHPGSRTGPTDLQTDASAEQKQTDRKPPSRMRRRSLVPYHTTMAASDHPGPLRTSAVAARGVCLQAPGRPALSEQDSHSQLCPRSNKPVQAGTKDEHEADPAGEVRSSEVIHPGQKGTIPKWAFVPEDTNGPAETASVRRRSSYLPALTGMAVLVHGEPR